MDDHFAEELPTHSNIAALISGFLGRKRPGAPAAKPVAEKNPDPGAHREPGSNEGGAIHPMSKTNADSGSQKEPAEFSPVSEETAQVYSAQTQKKSKDVPKVSSLPDTDEAKEIGDEVKEAAESVEKPENTPDTVQDLQNNLSQSEKSSQVTPEEKEEKGDDVTDNRAAKDHGKVKDAQADVQEYCGKLNTQKESSHVPAKYEKAPRVVPSTIEKASQIVPLTVKKAPQADSQQIEDKPQDDPEVIDADESNEGICKADTFQTLGKKLSLDNESSTISPTNEETPLSSRQLHHKNTGGPEVLGTHDDDSNHRSLKLFDSPGSTNDIQKNSPVTERAPPPVSRQLQERTPDQSRVETDSEIVMKSLENKEKFDGALVGKYIELTQGTEDFPRKAFVEIFDVIAGTHVVEFCDRKGGTEQVYLTEENHRTLDEKEVKMLCRRLGLTEDRPTPSTSVPADEFSREVSPVQAENECELHFEPPERAQKRKAASHEVAGTRARSSQRLRRMTRPSQAPGAELIGKCIQVKWPGNGGVYDALVLGFQNRGVKERQHKVYYTADESTEVLDLSKREWNVSKPGEEPWDPNGLVGKRLVVYWNLEDLKEVQEQKRGKKVKENIQVPFEAFVVQMLEKYTYRLLYTQDDSLDDRDLFADQRVWDVLEPGVFTIDKMPVVSWSYNVGSDSDEYAYM